MEVIPVTIRIRGVDYEVEAPGPDAPDDLILTAHLNMMLLALLALDDPRIDSVLSAFGFQIQTGDGRQIFPPKPVEEPDPEEPDDQMECSEPGCDGGYFVTYHGDGSINQSRRCERCRGYGHVDRE